jgi:hypothetical protein
LFGFAVMYLKQVPVARSANTHATVHANTHATTRTNTLATCSQTSSVSGLLIAAARKRGWVSPNEQAKKRRAANCPARMEDQLECLEARLRAAVRDARHYVQEIYDLTNALTDETETFAKQIEESQARTDMDAKKAKTRSGCETREHFEWAASHATDSLDTFESLVDSFDEGVDAIFEDLSRVSQLVEMHRAQRVGR